GSPRLLTAAEQVGGEVRLVVLALGVDTSGVQRNVAGRVNPAADAEFLVPARGDDLERTRFPEARRRFQVGALWNQRAVAGGSRRRVARVVVYGLVRAEVDVWLCLVHVDVRGERFRAQPPDLELEKGRRPLRARRGRKTRLTRIGAETVHAPHAAEEKDQAFVAGKYDRWTDLA